VALSIRGPAVARDPCVADVLAAGPIAVGNLTTAAGSGLPLPRSELILAGKSLVRAMRRVTDGTDPSGSSPSEIAQLQADAARIAALASILAPSSGLAVLPSDAADAQDLDAESASVILERFRCNFGQLGYMQGVLDANVTQLDGQLSGLDSAADSVPAAEAPEVPADPAELSDEELQRARSTWAVRADVDFDALIRAQDGMNDIDDRRRNLDHQVDAMSDLLARLDDAGTTLVPRHIGETLCYGLGWHLTGDATRMIVALRESRSLARPADKTTSVAAPATTTGSAGAKPQAAQPRPQGTPFTEWAAANNFIGGRLAVLQALAGLQRWCGFYDALTGTLQRQLSQLRAQADTASSVRRALSAELQRRTVAIGDVPAPVE
jgi:hypothetical protein